jgi:hypothetical protein
LDSLALHAFGVELAHPESGQMVRFEAPHPLAFQSAITWLRSRA